MSWKIVIPLSLLMLAPLPAPWRAYFEKRAYFVQLFVEKQVWNSNIDVNSALYASWFRTGAYYWMWPFEQDAEFAQEVTNIKAGKPSWTSDTGLVQMVNDLIAAAKV